MTKRAKKERVDLSSAPAAIGGYRATAKMLANLERRRRLHIQPAGRGPRARKIVMMQLYPMEYAAFLGLIGVGMVPEWRQDEGRASGPDEREEIPRRH